MICLAKHKYIDINILKDFSEPLTHQMVYEELADLNITNIRDDYEDDYFLWLLAGILFDDYTIQRANYRSYVEGGMNLRILAELRKSAVLPIAEEDYYFYTNHCKAETVRQIKNVRKRYFRQGNEDYDDEDWQYMAIMKYFSGAKGKDFAFDFNGLFADGDPRLVKDLEDYKREFLIAHFQGFMGIDFRL